MDIFPLSSLVILVIVSLIQPAVVGGHSNSVCGGIFEGDVGAFEYHGEDSNVDSKDLAGSSVCVWMIKLLMAEGAGVSFKLEDLDQNSVVNLYSEGEPTNPVNTPITMDSSQINSVVELRGKNFIITLKSSQVDQFENPATKLVVSWSALQQMSNSNTALNSNGSNALPVQVTSANYFAAGGQKGWYNFKNSNPLQKSVWIVDAGFGGSGSLNAEVNVEFDSSSCLSKMGSSKKSRGASPKAECECSYFGLFEILPSTGKLRSLNEFCGRSGSLTLTKLSTKLVVFFYSMDPHFGESAEISWERNKETTNPTTTTQSTTTESTTTSTTTTTTATESPTNPDQPIKAILCPDSSIMLPCTCGMSKSGVEIRCAGPAVNQSTIENALVAIRKVNRIPQDRGVDIQEFLLEKTELAELNMAPFYNSQMDSLFIQYNFNLTKLTSSGNVEDHASIHADSFYVIDSPLNREGFGDTLKYFSNDLTLFHLSNLLLKNNKNDSSPDEGFLPGLSSLLNLRTLTAENCSVAGRLDSDSWYFQGFQHIQEIDLRANGMTEIGEGVFNFDLFDEDENDDEDPLVQIVLSENNLTETSFHPNSGLAKTGHNTHLFLSYNQITSLPAEIFEVFLDAHPKNFLDLYELPLICDQRLSWVKARKDDFYNRIWTTGCSNDPGHDMFDSDLIP